MTSWNLESLELQWVEVLDNQLQPVYYQIREMVSMGVVITILSFGDDTSYEIGLHKVGHHENKL